MKYAIHLLELNRPITAPSVAPSAAETAVAPDGTLAILEYRSLVRQGQLEPDPAHHLVAVEASSKNNAAPATIEPGLYLFAQGDMANEDQYRQCAEEVWLESLWRECTFTDDRIQVRILSEDGKTVFQVFRKITNS